MNIVLTGFMGTGKSAVGEILARRLGWALYDTDQMIEKQTGHSVADLFAKGGEAAFRDMERQTVALVALLDKAVVATGGGVPLSAENMTDLEKNGIVICLTASAAAILDRLRQEIGARPLLKGGHPMQRIEELLRARHSAYARCRTAIATDGKTLEQVADLVLAAVPAVKP